MENVTATISRETLQLLDGAVEAGVYAGRSDGVRTAIRSYVESNPELARNVALRLYEDDDLDLLEAAKLADVPPRRFRDEIVPESEESDVDE